MSDFETLDDWTEDQQQYAAGKVLSNKIKFIKQQTEQRV